MAFLMVPTILRALILKVPEKGTMVSTPAHVHTCVYVYVYLYVYMCVYVCMHACMHVCSRGRASRRGPTDKP